MKKSLLVQLSSWYALSAFALILFSTIYLYWSVQSALAHRDAEVIEQKAHTIRSLLAQDPERRESEWGKRKFERIYVRILDQNNQVVTETPDLSPSHRQVFDELAQLFFAHQRHDVTGKFSLGDQTFRAGAIPLETARIPHGVMMIALDRSDEEHILQSFQARLLIVVIFSLAACLLVGYRIAKRGIFPLEKFSRVAQELQPTNLHKRIDPTDFPSEFSMLATQFNEMLARLQHHMNRISEFSSDIAHELRTPINNLTGQMSVGLSKSRQPNEYREILSSGLEECQRIHRIIESLLFIARAEQPDQVLNKERVNLDEELNEIASFYEPAATEKGLALQMANMGNSCILANRTLFQRAIGNLISNAINYTPPGGQISISTKSFADHTLLQVEDTGIGICSEHLPQIFQRFYRADHSRSKNSGGVGLGLAIAKSVIDLHGWEIAVESQPDQGTKFSVRIPQTKMPPQPLEV